jgi:hypothetical protein
MRKKGTFILRDAEISGDRNVIKKEAEKILQYKGLTTDIPVINGATGTISNSSTKHLSNLPGSTKSRN